MKLTIFLLTVAGLHLSAKTFSQETITLSEKNASLESILKKIEQQTGYQYFLAKEWIQDAKTISIEVSNARLERVLDLCFQHQPFSYEIVKRTIVIRKKAENGTTKIKDNPAFIVEGNVTDENGQPLVGATIAEKGGKVIGITDNQGHFATNKVNSDAILEISFTGYESKLVRVSGQNALKIFLTLSKNPLDAAQVIAYGTTTKRLNTGNVSTVKLEDIEKQPISNPLAAIEGRVPGMFITQTNGLPGSSFKVQIRGQNSIFSGNDPLYIIDGVPYTSQLLPNQNPAIGNPLNFIDPASIESIDVLKDADATAIYGSRGSNGVVLITTIKGKSGRSSVNINAYSGVGKVNHFLNLLSTSEYLKMRHEAYNNSGINPTAASAPDLFLWDTSRYTDWQRRLIGNTAHFSDVESSVSGGNINTQYILSGNYHKETTVFPGDFSDQKVSVHFNVSSISPDQKLKMSFSGNYTSDDNNLPASDFTGSIRSLAPDAPPIYNSDGTLNWAHSTWTNPFSSLQKKYTARTNNLVSNALLSYTLLHGLDLKVSLGYTDMTITELNTTPIASINPAYNVNTGTSYFVNNAINSWIIEPQINYKRDLSQGKLNVLIGSTFQKNKSVGQTLDAEGFSSDALLQNIQSATSITIGGNPINTVYKYNAIFARINYNWNDKYIINLTSRRDGSSRFGPANQFHDFSAVGFAWMFSNEKFIQTNTTALSFGKIRGSYGTTGNDQIEDYKFMDLFFNTIYPYQGIAGIYPSNLSNPNIAWEVNRKLEIGLELGFMKDKILLSASYFRNRSSNQLVNYPLPAISGFTSITANLPALVQNAGLEFTIQTTNVKAKNFTWKSFFNLSLYTNKLLAYPNLSTSPYNGQFTIGKSLQGVKVIHFIDVNDTTGIYEFAGLHNTPTYNPNYLTDRNVFIDLSPEFYGGLQNSFHYKNFALDLFIHFVKQTGRNFQYQFNTIQPGYKAYNQLALVMNRWQQPGDIKPFEKFGPSFGDDIYKGFSNIGQSDVAYADASYIRLKNVSLSYNLPSLLIKKAHLQSFRVYIQCQNLFTFSNHYVGFDPETQSSSAVPTLKVITGGFQIIL